MKIRKPGTIAILLFVSLTVVTLTSLTYKNLTPRIGVANIQNLRIGDAEPKISIPEFYFTPVRVNNTSTLQRDFFPAKATIRYAKNFSIQYYPNFKVVNIFNFSGKLPDTVQYLLIERGTQPPAGFKKAQRITIPLRSVIALSSLHIAMLDFSGSLEHLVGLGSFKYVNSSLVRTLIRAKKIKEVGTDASLNNETIISLHPDILMVDANPDSKSSRYQTLKDAGIPVMINAGWLENTPLGRTEWVKLMAAFLDKEAIVNKKFGLVEKHYHQLVSLSSTASFKPTVMIGMPFKGTWFVPAGKSFMAAFLQDAGMNYKWAETPGSGSLSYNFETVAPIALVTDFWLDIGTMNSKSQIIATDIRYADFKAVKTRNIFNNNNRVNDLGSNDYWESGAVYPDIVLQDLIKIAHPELLPTYKFVYYKKL